MQLTPQAPPLDKCGQPIEVGNFIVYGHALGRCAGLKFGRVLKVEPKANVEYLTHGPFWNIHVIGIDDEYSFVPHMAASHAPKLSRKGVLNFPERIVVLGVRSLPFYARDLLRSIEVA